MRALLTFVCLAFVLASTSPARAEDGGGGPRAKSPLFIVGATSLIVGYAPALAMGLSSLGYAVANFRVLGPKQDADALVMAVPVAGPLIYAQPEARDDLYRDAGPPSGAERALLYTSASLQIVGFASLLIDGLTGRPTKRDAGVVVAPTSSGVVMGRMF